MSSKKSFLIIEDHPEVAERNCVFLKKEVENPDSWHCIYAENPQQGRERLKLETTPDLIVLDLQFDGVIGDEDTGNSGLKFLKHIFSDYPQLNILVYTTSPNLLEPIIPEALKHQGNFAVADKHQQREDFCDKARNILNGNKDNHLILIPSYLKKSKSDSIKLSKRQREVLHYVCIKSYSDQEIADNLHITRKAVQKATQSIREKLDIEITHKNISTNAGTKTIQKENLRVLMCNKAREKKLI